jgi:hypothetical protein
MTETELSASAKRIADAVMRGEYGSVVSDDGMDGPEYDSYAGWGDWTKNRKITVVAGVVLGVLVVAGAIGGYYYYKKHHGTPEI